MTPQETINYLVNESGLDTDTIQKIASNPKMLERAGSLIAKQEHDTVQQKASQLEAELQGDAASGKLGARAYQEWWNKNGGAVVAMQREIAQYRERFGALDATQTQQTQQTQQPKGISVDDIDKRVDSIIQDKYGAQWSNLLTKSGKIIERHLRAKRDNPIDWDQLGKLAGEHGGDLERAYEAWDKPEAEKYAKAETEKEIERRVQEKLKLERTRQGIEGHQFTQDVSPISKRAAVVQTTKTDKPAYDRNKVIEAAVNADDYKRGTAPVLN